MIAATRRQLQTQHAWAGKCSKVARNATTKNTGAVEEATRINQTGELASWFVHPCPRSLDNADLREQACGKCAHQMGAKADRVGDPGEAEAERQSTARNFTPLA